MNERVSRRPGFVQAARQEPTDLNETLIRDEANGRPLEDFGGWLDDNVEVYFRDLHERLISKIEAADYVFGCVAWLTHPDILAALAKKKGVCIIVQKEDFLRPDVATKPGWARSLRHQYAALRGTYRASFSALSGLSYCTDLNMDAVRCVGNINTTKSPAHPRSHHKFVVFAKGSMPQSDEDCDRWEIQSVWTGSFNFTKNAVMSFENAVVLRGPLVVRAFYDEFQQIAALSEPLDWETPWSAPEWRIGT